MSELLDLANQLVEASGRYIRYESRMTNDVDYAEGVITVIQGYQGLLRQVLTEWNNNCSYIEMGYESYRVRELSDRLIHKIESSIPEENANE